VCGLDVGFPNRRRAERADEIEALNARVKSALAASEAKGAEATLIEFGSIVDTSHAVMNRSLTTLQSWLMTTNGLFSTFHQQVRAGLRSPDDSIWDDQRASAENTVNPHYYSDLNFAALTLDRQGLIYYGPFSVLLRDELIAPRTSVFEENPFEFNRKHAIISGQACPAGYRAPWERRGDLAMAKLQSKISASTSSPDFPGILMERRAGAADCDFIEAHIYGTIHQRVIKHVSGPAPKDRSGKAIWKQVKRKIEEIGATWEEF
jgi:hypothetical protein